MDSQWKITSLFLLEKQPSFSGNIGILFVCLLYLCVCFRKVFFVHFFMGDPLPKFKTFWRRKRQLSSFPCKGTLILSTSVNLYKRVWGTRFCFCAVIPLLVLYFTHMLSPSSRNSNVVKINFCHPKHFCTRKTVVISQDCSGMYVSVYPFTNQFLLVLWYFSF